MIKFTPKTQTINQDRCYFIDGDHFIKEDTNIKRGRNEAKTLSRLSHDYIQQYVDSYEQGNKHLLITKLFKGETLENLVLNTEQKIMVTSQLFNVYSYLIKNETIHGDINVSNVLFNNTHIYLIDWETSREGKDLTDLTGQPWGILDLIDRL